VLFTAALLVLMLYTLGTELTSETGLTVNALMGLGFLSKMAYM